MRTLGDRLFVFSRNKLVLINVAQDNEFLEDTIDGMGVTHPAQVVEVEGSMFIVNGRGLSMFDGQKFTNMSQKIGQDFDADDSSISYEPKRKNLFVWKHKTELYLFNLVTATFIYRATNFNDSTQGAGIPTTNTLFLPKYGSTSTMPSMAAVYFSRFSSSQIQYCVLRYAGYKVVDNINDINTVYAQEPRTIRSGVIAFENAPQRKKIYNVYVNAKLAEDSVNSDGTASSVDNVTFLYSIDRGENWVSVAPEGAGDSYLNAGENKLSVNATCKDFQFGFYANTSCNADIEIGDISIVYRDKPLR